MKLWLQRKLAQWFGEPYRCQGCLSLSKGILSTEAFPVYLYAMCPCCDRITSWKQDGYFLVNLAYTQTYDPDQGSLFEARQ